MLLMPAALIIMYSAECTVGQIAHKSSELCKQLLPEPTRELTKQDGSPTVFVGPKLLLLLPVVAHISSCFTSILARRLDSGSGIDGGATASANDFTPSSDGATRSANVLPFPYSSLVVLPQGTDPQ